MTTPLTWQQPLWGAMAQVGAEGGGGVPADPSASFLLLTRLESPIGTNVDLNGMGGEPDGQNGFVAPCDLRLKAWSERVTRSGGYRQDMTFSYRVNGGTIIDLATITAGTEDFRVHDEDILFSEGDEIELFYSCGNNYNMGVGVAFYFEADAGSSSGPFYTLHRQGSLGTGISDTYVGGRSGNYNVWPISPVNFVYRRAGYGLSAAAAAEHTAYVSVDGQGYESIGTLAIGETSTVFEDIDRVVLRGQRFGFAATGGAASEPDVMIVGEGEIIGKDDAPNLSYMWFTDDDADAAQNLNGAKIVPSRSGTITDIVVGARFGFTDMSIGVTVNGGAYQELVLLTAASDSINLSSPNFAFSAGDELVFSHDGTDTTGAGISVCFTIETANADDYVTPEYTAPVADQPAGDSRQSDLPSNTENTGYNYCKGHYVLCREDRYLTGIYARLGASAMDTKFLIAECDYNYDIVALTVETDEFVSVDGYNQVDLDTPVLLEAGKIYLVQAMRSDLNRMIIYQDSDPVDMDQFFPWIGQANTHDDITPVIGENYLNTAASADNQFTINLIHERVAQRDTFKFWSILVEGSDDGAVQSIAEVAFREAPGGSDVVPYAALLASAYDDGFLPENALDADASTVWKVTDADYDAADRRVIFAFNSPVDIVEFDVTSDSGADFDQTPTDMRLQFSQDGITWYDAITVSGESAWSADETRTFTRGDLPSDPALSPHRYWCVMALESTNASYNHIAELEMRESIGGADVTTTGFAISGDERTGFEAIYAFDDTVSGSNSWGVQKSVTIPINRWVGQDFGSGNEKTIVEVAITTRDDSFEEQAPHAAIVCWSDDGVTWYPSWSIDDKTSWSAAEQRVYSKP